MADISTSDRQRIAVIVPYRNRDSQLRTFLKHIHPFLIRQSLNYRLFVVELVRPIYIFMGKRERVERINKATQSLSNKRK